MRYLVLFFSLVSLLAIPAAAAQSGKADALVSVAPQEDGNWHVAYTFEEPQTALVFARSDNNYRSATWQLETEEARFGRVNDLDVIVFDDPAKEVSFSIVPVTSTLVADYTPFIPFGDGGLAIYEGQFALVPFESLEAVEEIEDGLPSVATEPLAMRIAISADTPIIVDGQPVEGNLQHEIAGDGTYIYLGDSEVEQFDSFTAILDASLPAWLGDRFAGDLQGIFAGLEALWGFELSEQATVFLASRGLTGKGMSNTGGALDNLLMMEVSGEALAEPDPNTLFYLQWFFAHEAVHLFQTDKDVTFASGEDAWIHEGAANTMAYNLIAAGLPDGGEKFLSSVYASAFEECVAALEAGPLETVGEREAFSANYACGDLIALATDGYLKRKTLYQFWDRLILNAVSMDDTEINRTLYFTTMQLLGATRAERTRIRDIVEEDLDDPREALTELLKTAGLNPQFDADGTLVKLDWPDYAAE
ncbi:MAG: hypothetical protein WA989_00520 [Henriciella sp.]|uniref:hypothetical protein n=1 Tax=Henriciella sp. TaxID=1968823 RepID=UPI003C7955CE